MIYYITIDELKNKNILFNYIYTNMEENYYWSDDFSNEFYIAAAKCGFITTSMKNKNEFVLLPEIQFEYALLDFDDIKISKKVKKLFDEKNYKFTINENFKEVCKRIMAYHPDSWLTEEYVTIINNIKQNSSLNKKLNFLSIELREKRTNNLISGEIGYKIGKIYTSLSGFTTREKKFNNWGKLQLVLLNSYLKENGFSFWNLGHPQLQYKIELGAKIYSRIQFLKRWYNQK
jgi:Leu/Phe-tRNA-protein transferase